MTYVDTLKYSSSVGNSIQASAKSLESQNVGCTGPMRQARPPFFTTLVEQCFDEQTLQSLAIQSFIDGVKLYIAFCSTFIYPEIRIEGSHW